jgi:diguanylate cyclase (GGDEF)-like protein
MIPVKEVMTKDISTLSEKNSLADLIELMSQRGIGSVIITDKNEKALQIFTLRDIPKLFSLNITESKLSYVLEKLNKKNAPLITIKKSQNLITAIALMHQYNISHLPVIDKNEKVVGILSMRDLLRHFPGIVFIDPLTGVNNRAYLDLIKIKLEKSKVNLCIMMIDIDNFKNINDAYGHLVGDMVLKKLARILKNNIKGHDEVIRYGGEEFLLILYRCKKENIYSIGERLRKQVKKLKIPEYQDIAITVSIGASLYNPEDDLFKAIEISDQAMYMAKREGKDRVKILN